MNDMLLAQESQGGGCGAGACFGFLVYLAIIVLMIAGWWKTFVKAGQPGWAAIIPIYNVYVLCQVAGRPGWWVILLFVPVANIVILILLSLDVARAFRQRTGFAIGLLLLPFVFYAILGFGSARYQGPSPQKLPPAAPPAM
jgi:hypothetical protein